MQNENGEILDLAGIRTQGDVCYLKKDDKIARQYKAIRTIENDYHTRLGSIWRGTAENTDLPYCRQVMLNKYETMSLHVALLLDRVNFVDHGMQHDEMFTDMRPPQLAHT